MQVCISLQTDNHASTPSLSILQAGCPSCRPTNSVKALKVKQFRQGLLQYQKPTNHPFYCHYTGQPALAGTSSQEQEDFVGAKFY